MFEDYQTRKLGELFDREIIRDTLEYMDTLSPQERAILRFIVDNPDEQYIQLQNTFTASDDIVMQIVLEYGVSSSQVDEMRELRAEMQN